MDVPTLWRAALLQLAAVALLSIALALALPHSFFEDWGWIAGPAAWMLCAAFTARRPLPPPRPAPAAVADAARRRPRRPAQHPRCRHRRPLARRGRGGGALRP